MPKKTTDCRCPGHKPKIQRIPSSTQTVGACEHCVEVVNAPFESLEDFKERVKEPGSDGNYVAYPEPVEDWEKADILTAFRGEANYDNLLQFIRNLLAQERERQKEIVICAAVQLHDGRVFRGHRHADCFAVMRGINPKIEWPNDNEQGFITSKNRFVSREEGRKLQDAAGIPSASEDGYQGNTLFSEDLY